MCRLHSGMTEDVFTNESREVCQLTRGMLLYQCLDISAQSFLVHNYSLTLIKLKQSQLIRQFVNVSAQFTVWR